MVRSIVKLRKIAGMGVIFIGLSSASAAQAAEGGQNSEPASKSAEVLAKLSEEGSALYKARDYRHAAEKFIQAYAIEQDPNLLFNIARCYEFLGDNDAAIEKYREFLAKPGADPQGKQRAEEAIRNMSRAKNEPATAPNGSTDTTSAAPSAATHPAEGADTAGADRTDHSLGPWPWITLGTGVAASAVGGIFYFMGVSDHDKVTSDPGFGQPGKVDSMTQSEAQSLVDSGTSKKTLGGVVLGVGGALLATSVVLFVLDSKSPEAERGVALKASVSPQHGALLVQGRF